ncbi:hypothetical protein [Pandoraea cepalis]|uniref:Uncharacterized protein n=2 Tax=Pandoraea TaxID=93217 RepID=A0A5E4TXB0_9BURK|nr:hypothetical protein [Pandoraea cepalis]VVD91843.1 hypothetical protein PCE31107_01665 [Pandoraea cepalis]
MTIGMPSSPPLPTPLQSLSNASNVGANPQVHIAMPEPPKDLMAGCWEQFQSAIQTHRGARNAALIGHVVNAIAKSTALGFAIATMDDDWKGYIDIPLHVLAASTEIASLVLAASKFWHGPDDIPGAEIRDTNFFQTIGQWTGIDLLREYGGVVNLAITNGPLVFGAVHNGAAPLLETLGIPVPAWLKDAAIDDASSAIADGVATATDFLQNRVLGTIIDGRERRASVDRVTAAETTVNYVVLDGERDYVHMAPRPRLDYELEGVTVVPRLSRDDSALASISSIPAPPAIPGDNADIQSLATGIDDEFFDAESDLHSVVSDLSNDAFHDALDTVTPDVGSRP